MKKKILFYARVSYLDASLEYIRLLSRSYDVNVLIELSHNELHSNIFDINADLSKYSHITSFNDVVTDWQLDFLKPYFANCQSINFVIYKQGKNILDLLKTTNKVTRKIDALKPDFIHFDDFSTRQSLLIPLVLRYASKIVLNIHDPSPHTGESLWYINIIKNVVFKIVKTYVVFSNHSKSILKPQVKNTARIFALKLLPYTVFRNFILKNKPAFPTSISFIGRLSDYKGVDLLLNAIPKVLKEYPNQHFIIAGKPVYNFSLNTDQLTSDNITIIQRHLSNHEIADIILGSKLIVCPYRDATQSGIIMTAFSLGRPVLISNIGGLPEYIQPNVSGDIVNELTSEAVGEKIIAFLKNNRFEVMANTIADNGFTANDILYNKKHMEYIYY